MVRLASPSSAPRSISALESNTIHSVSARLKTAAAVDAANGNDSFRLAPWRLISTATLPPVLAARGGGGAGGGAGGAAFAVSAEGAGIGGGVSGAAICASTLGVAAGLSAGDGGD